MQGVLAYRITYPSSQPSAPKVICQNDICHGSAGCPLKPQHKNQSSEPLTCEPWHQSPIVQGQTAWELTHRDTIYITPWRNYRFFASHPTKHPYILLLHQAQGQGPATSTAFSSTPAQKIIMARQAAFLVPCAVRIWRYRDHKQKKTEGERNRKKAERGRRSL